MKLFSFVFFIIFNFEISALSYEPPGQIPLNISSEFTQFFWQSLAEESCDLRVNELCLTAKERGLIQQWSQKGWFSFVITDMAHKGFISAGINEDLNMCGASVSKVIAVPAVFEARREGLLKFDMFHRKDPYVQDLKKMILYSNNSATNRVFKSLKEFTDEKIGYANMVMQAYDFYSPGSGGLFACTGYASNCASMPEANERTPNYAGRQIATARKSAQYFIALAQNKLCLEEECSEGVHQELKDLFEYPVQKSMQPDWLGEGFKKEFPVNYGLVKALVSSTKEQARPQHLYRKTGSFSSTKSGYACANDVGYVKYSNGKEYVAGVFITVPKSIAKEVSLYSMQSKIHSFISRMLDK